MLQTDDLELLSSLSENSYGALLALFANHPLGKNLEFLERVFFSGMGKQVEIKTAKLCKARLKNTQGT